MAASDIERADGTGAERAAPDARRWPAFALTVTATALVGAATIFVALLLADPYGSGRLSLRAGRPTPLGESPRFANAALGRDPVFDAAVIGNSHIQLIDPAALSSASGDRWVSLATPGAGPREQLALLDWFARAHAARTPRAVLIGVDAKWCVASPEPPLDHPFPFWLYGRSDLAYAAGLFRLSSLDALRRHAAQILRTPKRARADGYVDYAATYAALDPTGEKGRAEREKRVDAYASAPAQGPYGPLVALDRALAARPSGLAVVLLRPPVFRTAQPAPGGASAAAAAACGAEMAALAARHPGVVALDWLAAPGVGDSANFHDREHYAAPFARRMEAAVAQALRDAGGGAR